MSLVERQDALQARLPSFQRKIDSARRCIEQAFSHGPCYVAFSGGKDSLVVLDLVRDVRGLATAIWSDDELEHDESPAYIQSIGDRHDVELIVAQGSGPHAEWFHPWTDAPFWRNPLPAMVRRHVDVIAQERGFVGTVLGLRQDENGYRRQYLRAKGRLHQTVGGTWRCNPIATWTTNEVWAYIHGRGLEHNPVYDRLAEIGVPRDEQRVGPLPLTPKWVLERGWPARYLALEARYGRRWG